MILQKDLLLSCAEKFGVEVDNTAFEKLEVYASMLIETNKQFNLTAITEPYDVTLKHFADSLSVFGFADIKEGASIIDVGTGAGFPGLVMLLVRPDLKLTFLDGTQKKLNFISNVLEATEAKANVVHARAEEAGADANYREKFDFATARAVSNMTNLSEYCLPFVKVGGRFISMKSVTADEEINDAKKAIGLFGGKIEKDNLFDLVENVPRRIIVIEKISHTPSDYPRPSAKIAKNPIK